LHNFLLGAEAAAQEIIRYATEAPAASGALARFVLFWDF